MSLPHALRPSLYALAVLGLLVGLTGCDLFGGVFGNGDGDEDEDEMEVEGTVEAVGADFLVVNALRYAVTESTEFDDGYASLSDVTVGDEVEVEYAEGDEGRVALEVEPDDGDDDDQEGEHDDDDDDDDGN